MAEFAFSVPIIAPIAKRRGWLKKCNMDKKVQIRTKFEKEKKCTGFFVYGKPLRTIAKLVWFAKTENRFTDSIAN